MLYAAATVAAVLAAAAAFRPEPAPAIEPYDAVAPPLESMPPVPTEGQDAGSRRLAYRHSVVPGGVFSDGELRAAMRDDPVVAAHFTTLGRTRLRTEIVPHDRLVYVSYRKGNDVYWTRNKVLLRAGETILTDGRTQIRTRCGNCISDAPVTPTADDEPEVVEFDALVADPAEESIEDAAEAPVGAGEQGAPALTAGGGPAGQAAAPSAAAPFVFPAAGPAPFVRWGGAPPDAPESADEPSPVAQPAADDPAPVDDPPPADDPLPADEPDDPAPADEPEVETIPVDDIPIDEPLNPVPVPEPGTLLLVGGGVAVLLRRLRARHAPRTTQIQRVAPRS